MTNQRRNTTQPIDWWEAWEQAASKAGMELAAWIGQQCNKALPKSVREELSSRGTRGRPKRDRKTTTATASAGQDIIKTNFATTTGSKEHKRRRP